MWFQFAKPMAKPLRDLKEDEKAEMKKIEKPQNKQKQIVDFVYIDEFNGFIK